jgi:hypothetical protein
MSIGEYDPVGVWLLQLDERDGLNPPGHLTVDGDEYGDGPVCILGFRLSSDSEGGEGEVDFGGFRLKIAHGTVAEITGSCTLGKDEAVALAEAIMRQVGA